MKDFEKPVFYVKDLKKSFSPSVVDWKKKQIKGRIGGEIKMFRFDEVEFLRYDEADANIIDCAKRIKEYCTYGKCDNCIFHSNGRCFTQPEVEDNYYNEEPAPIFPIDWDLD